VFWEWRLYGRMWRFEAVSVFVLILRCDSIVGDILTIWHGFLLVLYISKRRVAKTRKNAHFIIKKGYFRADEITFDQHLFEVGQCNAPTKARHFRR